jgi:hypothetical protein
MAARRRKHVQPPAPKPGEEVNGLRYGRLIESQLAAVLAGRFGDHCVEPVAFTAAIKSEMAGRLRALAERGVCASRSSRRS